MAHASKIPSFKPDADWYDDWPYGTDTLVQAQAELAGSGAAQGLNSFLATLIVDTTSHAASGAGTYYQGGYVVHAVPSVDGSPLVVTLGSAGEDGFDSLHDAADSLVAALRAAGGEISLTWQALPATKVGS